MRIDIELLGPVAVRADGACHHLQSAQARIAFARLALARHEGVTRDELADVVWPASLPPTWASALRTLVSRLRSYMAPFSPGCANPLEVRGGRYVLELGDKATVDIEQARRFVIAAQDAFAAGDVQAAHDFGIRGTDALRAPFLSEHDGTWVMEQRERLAEFLVTGLEIASQAACALGNHRRAVLLANEATSRAPVRESAHRCLMAAHAALGNRGEALRAYQGVRRILAEELGVDPSPDTEAAYLDLLGPSTPTATGPYMEHSATRLRRLAPFVNRTSEMTTLAEAWGRAVRGRRQLVFVTGEAGVGKTQLVQEAGRRIADDGGLLLLGRCDDDVVLPYQPFVEAIDGYLAATPDDPMDALSGAARAALQRVLPSFQGPCPPEELPDQALLFSAMTDLLLAATRERPVALLLDDMHWADVPTLRLLQHIMRRSVDAPLYVVAVARDDVWVPLTMHECVRRLEHEGQAVRVPLDGIDLHATRTLVDRLAPGAADPDGKLARFLQAQTAGNPFMLLEFIRQWAGTPGGVSQVPPGIVNLVSIKQAGLSEHAGRMLQVAAVAGASFEFDHVARAAGLDEVDALEALELILRAGLLNEVTTLEPEHASGNVVYRFRQEVVRRVVEDQLSYARRRHLTDRLQAVSVTVEDAPDRQLVVSVSAG